MPKNYDLFLKGTVGGWNFNADMVNYVLDRHKDSEVHVLIDSLGGYVNDALSISSLFKLHANVHVHFVGMNASAATIAAMGAKHITIDRHALFLVHKCLVTVFEWDLMNADQLEQHIKDLEKLKDDNATIDGCIAGMYASRCKKPKDDLLELMKKGAWLTAQQALEWGFVDEITSNDEDDKPVLDSKVASVLATAGIPMPPVALPEKRSSLFDRLIAFFSSQSSNRAPEDNSSEGATSQSPIMAKLTALAALLGAALSMTDDKLVLTDEQATKVNDSLDEKDRTIASLTSERDTLKASLAEKEQTIADLKKEPAAPTSAVVDTKKDDPDPYAPVSEADALAAAQAFMEYSK